jgi:hypothetical protein
LVLILLIIAVLGLGVFALNHFGVIHLWGKKAVQVTEAFPEPALPEPTLPEAGGQPGQAEAPATVTEPAPAPGAVEQTPQITPPPGQRTGEGGRMARHRSIQSLLSP